MRGPRRPQRKKAPDLDSQYVSCGVGPDYTLGSPVPANDGLRTNARGGKDRFTPTF